MVSLHIDITRKRLIFTISIEAKKAFLTLKRLFTTVPILITFDPEKYIVIETGIFRFIIAAIIS